jgi:hypothetical protein
MRQSDAIRSIWSQSMSDTTSGAYEPIMQIVIVERHYDLMSRQCSNCEAHHREIWRWSGSSFARYRMRPDFTDDDFEQFVGIIDAQLLQSAPDLLEEFHEELQKVNCPQGIEADFTFAFRLVEYGRQRVLTLQKLRHFDDLVAEEAPTEPDAIAVRAAFELGVAAAEHRIMVAYEGYFWDGIAMSEWREAGLPKARQERLR